MKVTDVKFIPVNKAGSKIKAFATLTINDVLVMKNFRIMDTGNGLWVGNPSTKDKNGKFWDDIFVVGVKDEGSAGQAFANEFYGSILRKYQAFIGESGDKKTTKKPANTGIKTSSPVFDDDVPF